MNSAGFKKTEIGEIPEDWEIKELKDFCDIKTGRSNSIDASDSGRYAFFDRSPITKFSDKYLFEGDAVIVPGEGKEFVPRFYSGKFDLHQRAYAIFNKDKKKPS